MYRAADFEALLKKMGLRSEPCVLFGFLAAVFLVLGLVLWLGLIPA